MYLFVLGFFSTLCHFDWTVNPVNQFSRRVNCCTHLEFEYARSYCKPIFFFFVTSSCVFLMVDNFTAIISMSMFLLVFMNISLLGKLQMANKTYHSYPKFSDR